MEITGIVLQTKKTILHTQPGQRIVTDLSVAGNSLKLPRKSKREIQEKVIFNL